MTMVYHLQICTTFPFLKIGGFVYNGMPVNMRGNGVLILLLNVLFRHKTKNRKDYEHVRNKIPLQKIANPWTFLGKKNLMQE